ncbi:MAG: glycosyltransferase family 2 protein [Acidobacteriota bacterium]
MISILVVNHNGRDLLRRCLRELGNGSAGEGTEVIVADNGSEDGSVAMVRREFPGVRLLELGENLGFGAANNRAAAVAKGDVLLLLNSDAWPVGDCLGRLRERLELDPRVGLVAPELRYEDGRPQFAWAPTTGVFGEAIQMARNRYESGRWVHRLRFGLGAGWYTAACVLVRRSAFEQIGGFDEGFFLYFEDVDLCLRLRRAGWRLAEVRGAVAVHLKGGSQTSERGELEYRRGQLRYYRKHRPAWENALLRRRLRGKFGAVADGRFRRSLLALLDS